MKALSYRQWLYYFRTLMVVLAFFTFANFWYVNKQRGYDEKYIRYANELRVTSQRIIKHAEEIIMGNPLVFENLRSNEEAFIKNLDILKFGIKDSDGSNMLPPSPMEIQHNQLEKLSNAWDLFKFNVDIIMKNQKNISKACRLSDLYSNAMSEIEHDLTEIMLILKKDPKNSHDVVKKMTEQMQEAEKIKDELLHIMNVNSPYPFDPKFLEKINKLVNDIVTFEKENTNSEVASLYSGLQKHIQLIKVNANNMVDMWKILSEVFAAKAYLFNNGVPILDLATALEVSYRTYAEHRLVSKLSAYFLGFLTFLSMMVWLYGVYKESEQNLMASEDRNKKLHAEIQKLLNELTGLAKGDLTVHIDVQDGITKEVGRAINYSVDALRRVVLNINETTQETSKAAEEATKIAKELAISSEEQAQEISETTNSVDAIVDSIGKVSLNASKSEIVALESVKIASKGGEVVRNTVSGMERIQAQIVDTSEKIRRLSESSQEISEIVSLIDGIAEQTNILSLNAAIQAATAGEAGKGFAVVADEVQQLAGKASYATKEIASLVKSIQTDTQQVITAMEQTRSEVVHGVTLAQDAGEALEGIEKVSNNLSELIQNISVSAKEQTSVSNNISIMMNVIKEIANKTVSGTLNTVQYIANLVQLITNLRHSASEFKLPKRSHESRK
jgi:twitching motility protein PilJ